MWFRAALGLILVAALAVTAVYVALALRPAPHTTAPGTDVQAAAGLFRDVTAGSGIQFTYRNGEEADHYALLESLGGGVALFDYDGDGLLDIFVTGGGSFGGPDKKEIQGRPCRLFKNLGDWKFRDVTAEAGLEEVTFYTHGVATADYDRDGRPDLLVTGWGRLVLLHNDGGRFTDVTRPAGLAGATWGTGAGFGDLDGDGYPELYVCQYVNWSFANHPFCGLNQDRDVCSPRGFQGLPHALYRNQGNGTLTEVGKAAGLRDAGNDSSKGLGVLFADVNGDGKLDVYVTNDTSDNFLYLNESQPGQLRLREVGARAGAAQDDLGTANASMGVDAADYDRTGRPSLWVTNYENEAHALYRHLGLGPKGDPRFGHATAASGIAAIGQRYVGFGTAFLDADNDGWEDLVFVNGHVIRHATVSGLRQKPVLLRNLGRRGPGETVKFADWSADGGPYFRAVHRGRGLAVGDLDNDGWPDLVISHNNEPVVLLRNEAGERATHHWLGVELRPRDHADPGGAVVTATVNGERLTRYVKGGGSYLSASDRRLLTGLGADGRCEELTIRWPSGLVQHWPGDRLGRDRYYRFVEGEEAPR